MDSFVRWCRKNTHTHTNTPNKQHNRVVLIVVNKVNRLNINSKSNAHKAHTHTNAKCGVYSDRIFATPLKPLILLGYFFSLLFSTYRCCFYFSLWLLLQIWINQFFFFFLQMAVIMQVYVELNKLWASDAFILDTSIMLATAKKYKQLRYPLALHQQANASRNGHNKKLYHHKIRIN